MQFQVEILSVVGPVQNQKGKNKWNAVEVAYKKDGKIEGKKLADFSGDKNYDAQAKEVFAKAILAKQGEIYNVQAEKINDYWNWIGFERAGAANTPSEKVQESPSASSKGSEAPKAESSGHSAGRVTGSNYETPEERTRKQRFIIRQSSLTTALTYFEQIAKKASLDEVMELAEQFVEFVYKKPDPVKELIEMGDDIPY